MLAKVHDCFFSLLSSTIYDLTTSELLFIFLYKLKSLRSAPLNKRTAFSACASVHMCPSVRGVLMDYGGARIGRAPGSQCCGLTSEHTPEHPGAVTPGRPGTSCCASPLSSWGGSGVRACDCATCFRRRGIIYCGAFMSHQPPWQMLHLRLRRERECVWISCSVCRLKEFKKPS